MIDRLICFLFGHKLHFFDAMEIRDALRTPLLRLGTCMRPGCRAVTWKCMDE